MRRRVHQSVATGWRVSALGARGKLTIGRLFLGYPDPEAFLTGFQMGLSDLGYQEIRNVEIVIRSEKRKPLCCFC